MTRGINYLCRAHYYLFSLSPMSTLLSWICRWVGEKTKEMLFKMRLKGKRIFFRKDLFKHLSVGLKFQVFEHRKGHRDPFLQNSLSEHDDCKCFKLFTIISVFASSSSHLKQIYSVVNITRKIYWLCQQMWKL